MNFNIGSPLPFRKPGFGFLGLSLKGTKNCLIPRNKAGSKGLRPSILAIRIRKNIDRDLLSLSSVNSQR